MTKTMMTGVAALALSASAASAAVLSVVPTPPSGVITTLPSYGAGATSFGILSDSSNTSISLDNALFKDDFGVKQVVPGATQITTFDSSSPAGQGLYLQGSGTVTVTFLGREAGFANGAAQKESELMVAGKSVRTDISTFGDSFSFVVDQGHDTSLLDLVFQTLGGAATVASHGAVNGGAIAADKLLSFTKTFNGGHSVIGFFEDIASKDLDLDDIVVRIDVVPVPLPASAWLLSAAALSLGLAGRRRA